MDQDAIAARCWALWLRQLFTERVIADDEIVSERVIVCQLERGHAHEHYSKTPIIEAWWGKT